MWTSQSVSDVLRHHRLMKARLKMVEDQLCYFGASSLTEHDIAIGIDCKNRIELVETWLTLLDMEERFIVVSHLIDGLDWAKVIVEYEKLWERENGRADRTLKRIQSKALARIADFMNTSSFFGSDNFKQDDWLEEVQNDG